MSRKRLGRQIRRAKPKPGKMCSVRQKLIEKNRAERKVWEQAAHDDLSEPKPTEPQYTKNSLDRDSVESERPELTKLPSSDCKSTSKSDPKSNASANLGRTARP